MRPQLYISVRIDPHVVYESNTNKGDSYICHQNGLVVAENLTLRLSGCDMRRSALLIDLVKYVDETMDVISPTKNISRSYVVQNKNIIIVYVNRFQETVGSSKTDSRLVSINLFSFEIFVFTNELTIFIHSKNESTSTSYRLAQFRA